MGISDRASQIWLRLKNAVDALRGPIRYDNPVDLNSHVFNAYVLLSDATEKAIKVPQNVVEVIVRARKIAIDNYPNTDLGDLEIEFWNAYGELKSSIRPAEAARTRHRRIFYGVLFFLLAGQFFFLIGDHVRSKLAEFDKQIVEIRGRAAAPNSTPTSTSATEQQIKQVEDSQKAYIRLSRSMIEIAGGIVNYPLGIFKIGPLFSTDDSSDLIVRGKLDILLAFLSGYLLHMLYGLLGACAFVLRQLSDQDDRLAYAHSARIHYSLRLNIGLLSGLAVSWFIKPGAGDATLVSLSPLALAFIAGYGSDLFFVALDKIVQAFTPAAAKPSLASQPSPPSSSDRGSEGISKPKKDAKIKLKAAPNPNFIPDSGEGGLRKVE